MIEFLSFFGLLAISLIGYCFEFLNLEKTFCIAFNSVLFFMIFGRCLITIAYNRLIREKKRMIIESILFALTTACLIILYIYYNINNAIVFKIIINALCFFTFCSIKYYVLAKNSYGKKYTFWQIVDFILVLVAFGVNWTLNENTLSIDYIFFIMALMIAIAIINEHILHTLIYWTYINLFKESVKKLVITGNEIRLVHPPVKNLDKDVVYLQCKIILNNCLFRITECYHLQQIVKEILMENGFSEAKAHSFSSEFLGILTYNLMRRRLDNWLLPMAFLDKIYYFKRTLFINKKK
jgi:hypothetical protein